MLFSRAWEGLRIQIINSGNLEKLSCKLQENNKYWNCLYGKKNYKPKFLTFLLKGKEILSFSNPLLVTFNFLFSTMATFIASLFCSMSEGCIWYADMHNKDSRGWTICLKITILYFAMFSGGDFFFFLLVEFLESLFMWLAF